MLLPGNEPQFLDNPGGTAVSIPTEIFRPAVSRRKHKYGKVSFQRESDGLLEGDVTWYTGKLRPSSGTQVGEGRIRRNAGVIISARINGVTCSRKLLIIAYLINVTGQLMVVPVKREQLSKIRNHYAR